MTEKYRCMCCEKLVEDHAKVWWDENKDTLCHVCKKCADLIKMSGNKFLRYYLLAKKVR